MTQSFIQPKGTLKPQTNIEDIQKQYAQLVSQPQAQPETKKEQDMLRQTVNDLVKSALMNPVEIPKPYKTIQDVFNANNGDRFKALGDWFNSPQFNRFAGGDLTFNPETKRMESTGTRIGREQEARLNADREKALEQQKQQLGIANDVYNAYNRMDIENMQDKRARELAEQELNWRKEENALDREFRRQERAADRANSLAISRLVHSGGGGGRSGLPSFSNITTVRKEFNAIPSVKNYNEIKRQYNNVNSVINSYKGDTRRSKGNNAKDQVLITTFNKILDPISVVRESEFARTAEGQGLLDKIQGAADKMVKGGSGLSPKERNEVFDAIQTMYNAQEQEARRYAQYYGELAERYGINPADVIGGMGFDSNNTSSNTNQPIKVGGYTVKVKGN